MRHDFSVSAFASSNAMAFYVCDRGHREVRHEVTRVTERPIDLDGIEKRFLNWATGQRRFKPGRFAK